MRTLDRIRDRAWKLIDRPGRLGETARKMNELVGRPLASEEELADRRAFAQGLGATPVAAVTPADTGTTREAAPVFVYTMDKQRKTADRLAQILQDAGVPFELRSLEGDAAAQSAVRRDSKGHRLPVVFIAGEVVGGRQELTNLGRDGIRQLVYG